MAREGEGRTQIKLRATPFKPFQSESRLYSRFSWYKSSVVVFLVFCLTDYKA